MSAVKMFLNKSNVCSHTFSNVLKCSQKFSLPFSKTAVFIVISCAEIMGYYNPAALYAFSKFL